MFRSFEKHALRFKRSTRHIAFARDRLFFPFVCRISAIDLLRAWKCAVYIIRSSSVSVNRVQSWCFEWENFHRQDLYGFHFWCSITSFHDRIASHRIALLPLPVSVQPYTHNIRAIWFHSFICFLFCVQILPLNRIAAHFSQEILFAVRNKHYELIGHWNEVHCSSLWIIHYLLFVCFVWAFARMWKLLKLFENHTKKWQMFEWKWLQIPIAADSDANDWHCCGSLWS